MYHKEECTCITCDNCGETYQDEHTGFSLYVDEESAHEAADSDEWYSADGKHYCPKCHVFDDNDGLVINMTRTKPLDWEEKEATGKVTVILEHDENGKLKP